MSTETLNATDRPVLYTFRRCPYAMRARMGIYASGIEMEWRELVLRNKPEHMVEISPKATVPVVQLQNGDVIDESLDVMLWALGENDPRGWLPQDPDHRVAVDAAIRECDEVFKYHLDRYKYPNRYEDNDANMQREAALQVLIKWDQQMNGRENLFFDKPCVADHAIFPFVRQFANVDRDWFDALDLPNVHTWLDRHLNSQIFSDIMEKRAPWQPEDEKTLFPPRP